MRRITRINNSKYQIFIRGIALSLLILICSASALWAKDWRSAFPEIVYGVIDYGGQGNIDGTKEFEAFMEKELRVSFRLYSSNTYNDVVEGMSKGKIDMAIMGAAQYAIVDLNRGGDMIPLAGVSDHLGDFGYYSVLIVRADSSYASIDDLQGKTIGFPSKESTSGYQAPIYFLKEAGYDVFNHFASHKFIGGHAKAILAVLNKEVDAATTWYISKESSAFSELENEGKTSISQFRILWNSPLLPDELFCMAGNHPDDMVTDVKKALFTFANTQQESLAKLTLGQRTLHEVTKDDYAPVIRMVKANRTHE